MEIEARRCSRCVMDKKVAGIRFDQLGECNYCKIHDGFDAEYQIGSSGLNRLLDEMRRTRRRYDCVVAASGGCDSSFLLHVLAEHRIRPLVVHFDNGWNSSIAAKNLEKMVSELGFDTEYVKANYDLYNDINRSCMQASIPEIDGSTDTAMVTVMLRVAEKHDVKYICDAHSFRTEGMTPPDWFYFDGKYIASISGIRRHDDFPNLWLIDWMNHLVFHPSKRVRPLYYVDYVKEDAKKMLNELYGWEWYGARHMDNKWTAFCSNYWLPKKFGIDLRLVEYSALVRSGQMTRENALSKLAEPILFDLSIVDLVKKELRLTDGEFNRIMAKPNKSSKDYETYKPTFRKMRLFFWLMLKMDRIPRTFYLKYCVM